MRHLFPDSCFGRATRILLTAFFLGTTLVACGGGGGGGGGGGAPVRVFAEQRSVEVLGYTSESRPDSVKIQVSVSRQPPNGLVAYLEHTSNGVSSVFFSSTGDLTAELTINFRDPDLLGAGLYPDTITISVCLDDFCERQVENSPITISVSYVVEEYGVDDPRDDSYSAEALSINANEMVWDPVSERLYATAASDDPFYRDSIVVIDPTTRQVERFLVVGNEPDQLALSAQSKYLYVGINGENKILRLTLPNLIPDLEIPLGTDSGGRLLRAQDIAASPEFAPTIAVTLQNNQSVGGSDRLAIFDNDVERARYGIVEQIRDNTVLLDPVFLVWQPRTNRVFSVGSNSTGDLLEFKIELASIRFVKEYDSAFDSGFGLPTRGLSFDQDLILDQLGIAVDPSTGLRLGHYYEPNRQGSQVWTVSSARRDRAYSIARASGGSGDLQLKIFDRDAFTLIRTVSLRPTDELSGQGLVTWGLDGIAYLSGNSLGSREIVLISGPALAGPATATPSSHSKGLTTVRPVQWR